MFIKKGKKAELEFDVNKYFKNEIKEITSNKGLPLYDEAKQEFYGLDDIEAKTKRKTKKAADMVLIKAVQSVEQAEKRNGLTPREKRATVAAIVMTAIGYIVVAYLLYFPKFG